MHTRQGLRDLDKFTPVEHGNSERSSQANPREVFNPKTSQDEEQRAYLNTKFDAFFSQRDRNNFTLNLFDGDSILVNLVTPALLEGYSKDLITDALIKIMIESGHHSRNDGRIGGDIRRLGPDILTYPAVANCLSPYTNEVAEQLIAGYRADSVLRSTELFPDLKFDDAFVESVSKYTRHSGGTWNINAKSFESSFCDLNNLSESGLAYFASIDSYKVENFLLSTDTDIDTEKVWQIFSERSRRLSAERIVTNINIIKPGSLNERDALDVCLEYDRPTALQFLCDHKDKFADLKLDTNFLSIISSREYFDCSDIVKLLELRNYFSGLPFDAVLLERTSFSRKGELKSFLLNLDKFTGLDQDTFLRILEQTADFSVFDHVSSFAGVKLDSELAVKIVAMERGQSPQYGNSDYEFYISGLLDHIDKFSGIDKETVIAFIKLGGLGNILNNPDKFSAVELTFDRDLVIEILESGPPFQSSLVLSAPEAFPGLVLDKEIALLMIKAQGRADHSTQEIDKFTDNIGRFSGIDQEVGRQLVAYGNTSFVLEHKDLFPGIVFDKALALEVINEAGNSEDYNFTNYAPNGIWDLFDNLDKYTGLDNDVFTLIFDKGYLSVVVDRHRKYFSKLIMTSDMREYIKVLNNGPFIEELKATTMF